jgi:hypothetical protein
MTFPCLLVPFRSVLWKGRKVRRLREWGLLHGIEGEGICEISKFPSYVGRKQRPKAQPHPKPQARRVRKEPPVYAAGTYLFEYSCYLCEG